ncbi:MAG: macro domain-containing protein [Candidatus Omnitrophota bacterium]
MGNIILKQGDITQEDVDVIVNAANTRLRGGGGVDGAIHREAGPSVLDECIGIGYCATGDAVITNAGNLKAKKIIHTVGPVWGGGESGEELLLKRCYDRSLQLAKENHFKTIALPAISTGVYRYPKDQGAEVALSVGLKHKDDFDEIRFICFSENDLRIYQDIYKRMTS